MSIKKAEKLFEILDKHLISNIVENRIAESVEHHYAVESIRQAVFIAAFIHEFDPDDPIDPRDFISLVK